MSKRKNVLLLIFLISLLFAINYKFLNTKIIEFLEESETGIVERVVDGDTAIINGNSTRFLGINTPEKGEKYYQEAKDFLEMTALNKTVKLQYSKEKYDKYGRVLAYIFINDANLNKEIVDEGYANFYFPSGRDMYYDNFVKAWEHCIKNNRNLCEKSENKCAKCIELKKLDIEKQEIKLYNNCSFECNMNGWGIKDEGRKKFVFKNFKLNSQKEISIIVGNKTNTANILYWEGEDYVWTSSGDTLFLRDEEGKLVLWESY